MATCDDRSWHSWLVSVFSIVGVFATAIFCGANYAVAQIVPDETLSENPSTITPNVNIRGLSVDRIDGGVSRGVNLFHSFREFNIGDNQRVYFSNPTGIENILTRVTGNKVSNILGTLGVDGRANLFLLNPNGILFGKNARLDVAGSFMASTANSFVFGDGVELSATNPQAPPLLKINLTPGLQHGKNDPSRSIQNQGNLTAGQDLKLFAGNLDLQGQLQAGKDLILQADTIKVRDTVTNPFIAVSGGKVLFQGNQSVDIFALNHPSSGLFSRGDMMLRSANSVGGDAHFWSGGNFHIEKLDEGLGNLFSSYDPIIRASGDVSFDSYTGASLHILAGGSVNIPGNVTITGTDTPGNSIQEKVILSDGTTVIDIDGSTKPIVDIRAGTTAFGTPRITGSTAGFSAIPHIDRTRTIADINIGNIINNGGVVFLTNQYQPNPDITGGIIVSSVNTRDTFGGGSVFLDSKESITVNGLIDVSALDVFSLDSFGNGGDITLLADANIFFNPGASIRSNGLQGGNITLTSNSAISVIGTDTSGFIRSESFGDPTGNSLLTGGDIQITAKSVSLTNGAQFFTLTSGHANAGSVNITAGETVKFYGQDNTGFPSAALSLVDPGAVGNAGNIEISTGSLFITNGAALSASTAGVGNGGNITINARDKVVFDGVVIEGFLPLGIAVFEGGAGTEVKTGAVGHGGTIEISTGSLFVKNGSGLATGSSGQGNAGRIIINARETVVFDGSKDGVPSSIVSQLLPNGLGNAGSIEISTGYAYFTNGAFISTSVNAGRGNAGRISISARERVVFDGMAPEGYTSNANSVALSEVEGGEAGGIEIATDFLTVTNGAFLSTNNLAKANPGNVTIIANNLELTNGGRILTNTQGSQKGGNITLKISDNITLAGKGSAVVANTALGSSGNGGNIFIDPRTITIRDGAQIAVNSQGTGDGGNIELVAGFLTLDNGRISAETSISTGGNITLNLQDLLLLRNASKISTNAGLDKAIGTGDGGNILINSPLIAAVKRENSDISANASLGNGGRVNITTQGIFGIEPRSQPTSLSDITASSESGIQGFVTINTPDVDPARGLVQLPANLVDASQQIAQTCTPRGQQASRFIATGRGGLPLSPDEPLRGRAVITDWVTLPTTNKVTEQFTPSPQAIVEAQGWIKSDRGDVMLVAQSPQTNYSHPAAITCSQ